MNLQKTSNQKVFKQHGRSQKSHAPGFALLLITALVCAIVALGACSKPSASNDENHFVVGFDQNFPPFGYVGDDGQYTGFDLELAQEVAKRNSWEFKAQPINWDTKDAELSAGTIDCIWNGFTIQGREDAYTFSQPYMDNAQVIVTRADKGIKSLADLKDKVVEVQIDSAAQALFEGEQKALADSFASLVTIPDYNTGFQDLEAGSCDALALDLTVAQFQTKDRGQEFKILDDKLALEQYGIAFKKGNEALRDKVEATLSEMVADGTVAKIATKYFGSDISTFKSQH